MDKADPAPLVCMCGGKKYLDVTVHKMIFYDNIKYMCSHCKYAALVPELQDKEILSKKDLALMKAYTIYYTHYVALRIAKNEKIESEEEKILMNAMEDIRTKKIYETKYDYKGRNGCYQKRFSYKTKKYNLYADTVLISEKNILYYGKIFWTITSTLTGYLGFMGYICTLIGLGANEEADFISIVRAVILSIPKPAKDIRRLQWLITAKEIDESRLDKEVVKGDYVVRIVLDSSWATATAHNVNQKVLEVFYDKNIGLKKYHFVLYQ